MTGGRHVSATLGAVAEVLTAPAAGISRSREALAPFSALWRQLTDAPGGAETTFDGLLHMGDDGNEIWVEASLSEPEKHFTVVHELVHARRQRAGEDLDDEREEPIVEMETIARVSRRMLGRMPSGLVLVVLHDYLTWGDATIRRRGSALLRCIGASSHCWAGGALQHRPEETGWTRTGGRSSSDAQAGEGGGGPSSGLLSSLSFRSSRSENRR